MKIVSLFSGIGGFELGFEQASDAFSTVLVCDNMETAKAVLRARFPHADLSHDIVSMKALPAEAEVVTAGFPCQDLSQAGRTAGLEGNKSSLISEVFRLLAGRIRARKAVEWVVVENVPFMLQLNGGQAMRAITDEFESLGYRWAYRVVDSFSFGLPQRRERVYLVASRSHEPSDVLLADDSPMARPETLIGELAHGFYWTEGRAGLGWAVDAVPTLKNGSTIGIASQPAVLLPNGRLVKPGIATAEKLQGFPEGWTSPAEAIGRPNLRWSLVGNAVSVPVTEWIGGRIVAPGEYDSKRNREFPIVGKMPRAARFDGKRRYAVEVSQDPIGKRGPSLIQLMGADYTFLSERATAGFLRRTKESKLRFAPGFIEAVTKHLELMSGRLLPEAKLDLREAG